MGQTPNLDDLAAELAAIKKELAELRRKTLSSIAVTDPSGVQMLSIAPDTANSNRPLTVMRDSNNNRLLQNDTVAGWGLAHPILPIPMYIYDGIVGTKTNSTTYVGLWYTAINALSKKIQYSFDVTWDSGVTSANVLFTYQPTGGSETTIDERTFTGTSGQELAGSFSLPTDVYDSSTKFNLYAKRNAGTGNVSAVPNYLQTRGQAV